MKHADVKVGQTYWAIISGKKTRVRIDQVSKYGGWDATNTATNRVVRIRTARRLTEIQVKPIGME